jgi:hypothetical protein
LARVYLLSASESWPTPGRLFQHEDEGDLTMLSSKCHGTRTVVSYNLK